MASIYYRYHNMHASVSRRRIPTSPRVYRPVATAAKSKVSPEQHRVNDRSPYAPRGAPELDHAVVLSYSPLHIPPPLATYQSPYRTHSRSSPPSANKHYDTNPAPKNNAHTRARATTPKSKHQLKILRFFFFWGGAFECHQ